MSPGETLGSKQSSGGGSEQRGKVCCFVMHGSCSHVAEMLHDALPPHPRAPCAGSMPTFPSSANIWKHLGTWSVSVAAKGTHGRCLKPPLNKAAPQPKALQRHEDMWVQLGAWLGRAFVSLRSPQHRDPSTQRRREARGKGGGNLHPFHADMLIPNTCTFLPGMAWPLHPSLSISRCLNQGAKPPWTRTRSFTSADGQRQGQLGKNKLLSLPSKKCSQKGS